MKHLCMSGKSSTFAGEIIYNDKRIESLSIDNNLIFPFSDDLAYAYKNVAKSLESHLLDLLYGGQALIKLTCNE